MSLMVWLPLNKSGDLKNRGLANVTVTNSGATYDSNGKIGGCYSFDGTDDKITITLPTNNLVGTHPFSICGWYNATSGKNYYPLFCVNTKAFAIHGGVSNRIEIYKDGTQTADSTTLSSIAYSEWKHVVITYDGTLIILYINGSDTNKHYTYTNGFDLFQSIKIGAFWSNSFLGYINDFRLYDHCLSPKEVNEISKGLVLHYPLDSDNEYSNLLSTYSYTTSSFSGNYVKIALLTNSELSSYGITLGDSITISGDITSLSNLKLRLRCQWYVSDSVRTGPTYNGYSCNDSKFLYIIGTWPTDSSYASARLEILIDNNLTTAEKGIAVVNHLKLEKGSNSSPYFSERIVHDCSGYGNDGTITGNLTTSTDTPRYDKCTLVNDTSSFSKILCSNLNLQEGPTTISFWNKPTVSTNTDTSKIDIQYSKNSYFTYCNYPYFIHNGDYKYNYTNFWEDGKWHFVTGIFDGINTKIYIDGTAITINTSTNTTTAITQLNYLSLLLKGNNIADFRIYATSLSADDVKELYNASALIDNTGNGFAYQLEESQNQYNMFRDIQEAITLKTLKNGLAEYTLPNCKCTLTDEGYRIYRTPNTLCAASGGTNSMWGGFVIRNIDNILNLLKSHTYLIEFDVKGQSSVAATNILWSNNCGHSGGGLIPTPSSVTNLNPVTANFSSDAWKHFSYKFTINDDVYKTCTTSYISAFTAGTDYVSYRDFIYGFGYSDTGELGTDLYINNLRMFDITTDAPSQIDINKTGQIEAYSFIENNDNAFIDSYKEFNSNQLIEI